MSAPSRLRPISALWPLTTLALLVLGLTWPVAGHLGTHVVDRQDPLLNTWIIAWEARQLLLDPLHLFQANIFYPYPYALAFSEILLSTAALVFPLRWAGVGPIASYNLAFLLAFFTTALGGYLFAFYLSGSRVAAVVAGVAFAFSPYRMGHLSQIQLLAFGWLPLALLFLDRLLSGRGGLRRNATLFAIFLLLQALASFYLALFAAVACAFYLVAFVVSRPSAALRGLQVWLRQLRQRRVSGDAGSASPMPGSGLLAVVVAALSVALIVLPFALPYFRIQRDLDAGWTLAENETFSASLQAYAYAPPETRLWGPLTRGLYYTYGPCCPPDTLFPGLTLLALDAIALVWGRGRRRWVLAGLLAAGFLLSLGPTLHVAAGEPTALGLPYAWLFAHVPGFNALRAPVRWASIVTLSLSMLAALGLARIGRAPVSWLALGLVLVEFAAAPLALVPAPAAPAVAGWLATRPPTRIVELPLAAELPSPPVPADQPRRAWRVSRLLEHQLASIQHWHTTPDGYSGFIPPSHGDFAREMQGFPGERSVALLQGLGVEYVVLHHADLSPERREQIGEGLPGAEALSLAAEVEGATVLRVAPASTASLTGWTVLAPPHVTAGQPFELWLVARADGLAVVPPTQRFTAEVSWDGGPSSERLSPAVVALPLIVEEVAVVPLSLAAPSTPGTHTVTVEIAAEGADEPPLHVERRDVLVVEGPAPAAARPLPVTLDEVELAPPAAPGSVLTVGLRWRALQPLDHYASLSLRLVAPDGNTFAQEDGPPGDEAGTLEWRPGKSYGATWQIDLPPDLPPGVYTVEVFWYDPATGRRAALWDDGGWAETIGVGAVELGQ